MNIKMNDEYKDEYRDECRWIEKNMDEQMFDLDKSRGIS